MIRKLWVRNWQFSHCLRGELALGFYLDLLRIWQPRSTSSLTHCCPSDGDFQGHLQQLHDFNSSHQYLKEMNFWGVQCKAGFSTQPYPQIRGFGYMDFSENKERRPHCLSLMLTVCRKISFTVDVSLFRDSGITCVNLWTFSKNKHIDD